MRRSCHALTILLASLACVAWAVGPTHSEAKAKPGWAGPIDCGYQPRFVASLPHDPLWLGGADDYLLAGDDQGAAVADVIEPPAPEIDDRLSIAAQPVPPAWLGCGGIANYSLEFIAERRQADSVPYTYSPYWRPLPRTSPAIAVAANPIWYNPATQYDPAFDAAVTGASPAVTTTAAAGNAPSRRLHWDEHDDYIACPLASDESFLAGGSSNDPAEASRHGANGLETASMSAIEGRAAGAIPEYNYMSAYDAAFGNECHSAGPIASDRFVEPSYSNEMRYERWNCDRGALPSLEDEAAVFACGDGPSAFAGVITASRRASRWIVIAAARTLEHVGAVLDDVSLTMESMVDSARETASSAIDERCWQ